MPRALCRCGQELTIPPDSLGERIVCANCGARVRVRKKEPDPTGALGDDGYIRFACPCGRRLKVPAAMPPSHGKCPDCGAIVPVPSPGAAGMIPGHPETETADLSPADLQALEAWTRSHLDRASSKAKAPSGSLNLAGPIPPSAELEPRVEAGLRVCPRCKRPVHLGAETCRECGTPVPRR